MEWLNFGLAPYWPDYLSSLYKVNKDGEYSVSEIGLVLIIYLYRQTQNGVEGKSRIRIHI